MDKPVIIIRLDEIIGFLKFNLRPLLSNVVDVVDFNSILEFELDVCFNGQAFRERLGDHTKSILESYGIPTDIKTYLLDELISRTTRVIDLAVGGVEKHTVYKFDLIADGTFAIHDLGDWRIAEYYKMQRANASVGLEHGDDYEKLLSNSCY